MFKTSDDLHENTEFDRINQTLQQEKEGKKRNEI